MKFQVVIAKKTSNEPKQAPKILLKPILSQEFVNKSVSQPTSSAPTPSIAHQQDTKTLKGYIELLTTTFHVNSEVQEYLRENTHFRVIAIVGKTPLKNEIINQFLDKDRNVFPKETKGIQLFIAKDRHFILNVNPDFFHKSRSGHDGEQELKKMCITLLKVCHSIVFVENKFDQNSIRLLRFAELMEFGHDQLGFNSLYVPNIIYVFEAAGEVETVIVKSLFGGSKLQENVHVIVKPKSTIKSPLSASTYNEDPQYGGNQFKSGVSGLFFEDIIKLAYQNPNQSMLLISPFTELQWFQGFLMLWKHHKVNYFFG